MSTPRVGFIGLGSQGGAMARRIVDEGYPLSLWARRPQTLEPYTDTAAVFASSPADVGANSEIVGICVVNDADVEDVLCRADGVLAGMAAGGVVAIHSTVHPDTCRRLADVAAARDVALVDAPVSGGGPAAAERRLLVMVGGEPDAVERCRPVFETFANPIIHLGPLGSGEVAKALNNLVFTAQLAVAEDTFTFAERLGVDRAAISQVLQHGSGASFASTILGGGRSITDMRGAAPLLRKDVDIAFDVARQRGVERGETLATLAESALAALEIDGS
jgi:3-hydroxyisobutyrate dehydrogenase-like beta-hydroxyacid dehydrogenase